MPILNIQIGEVGLVGVKPKIVYIDTNDTVAEVMAVGYLNKAVQNGASFSEWDMALVSTKTSQSATSTQVGWLEVSKSGANWSLVPSSNDQIALPSGQILVGSVAGVATPVAMSGDATLVASGALTIAANAITTAKILAANVTLAKLAAGITPAYIIKLGGKDVSAGGSATVTIAAAGVVATDLAFAAIQASANAVSIQKVTAGINQVVVLCSGDPGAATICWEAHRAAS